MKCCALYTRLRRMFLPQPVPACLAGPCPEGEYVLRQAECRA